MLVFFHLNCDSIRPFYLMLIHLIFHSDDLPPGSYYYLSGNFLKKSKRFMNVTQYTLMK